jgi:hypothetical protein
MGVLVVSSLTLFGNLGRSRQDTLDQASAAELALVLIQEIKLKAYADPVSANEFGKGADETGPDRTRFDDIDDYDQWTETPPQDAAGQPYSQYAGLTRTVAVRYVQANNFTATAPIDQGFKEVTVTVKRGTRVLAQQVYVFANAPTLVVAN